MRPVNGAVKFLKRFVNVVQKLLISYKYLFLSFFFSFLFLFFLIYFVLYPDIANALVAFGTLILAVVASLSILISNDREKRRAEEDLLKEIIEWAINVVTSCFDNKKVLREMARITNARQGRRVAHAHIAEMKESFMGLRGRNKFISKSAEKFETGLQEDVKKLITDLEAYIELLDGWQHAMADAIDKGIATPGEYINKADEHVGQLQKSANSVIEGAVKIMP